MALSEKNYSATITDLGLGDILKNQVEQQTEAARQSALKNRGASDAVMSMSPATQSLFGFMNGGASGALS